MIDVDRLNLSPFEKLVFAKHSSGMDVKSIARELGIDEYRVRHTIATVWRKDKIAMHDSRATERASFINSLYEKSLQG